MYGSVFASVALALASPSGATDDSESTATQSSIEAELLGHRYFQAELYWIEYEVRFTNLGKAPVSLSTCPKDSNIYQITKRSGHTFQSRAKGEAVDFSKSGFSRACSQAQLQAGESVEVKFFFDDFSDYDKSKPPRYSVLLKTSVGDWFIKDGIIQTVAAARREAAG